MSKVFPKDKRKRSQTSSNEDNISAVRSTVISRWFSNNTSANGSAPAGPPDPQDEALEQPPPSKRVCTPNSAAKYNSSSYGLSDSFVKNVTQRVSGLLPSTITKWFSSPSSGNGSARQGESTDSSTEDEALEPPPQPPPIKRPCYPTPGKYTNQFELNDANNTEAANEPLDSTEMLETGTYHAIVHSPPSRTTFRRETNFVSTPLLLPLSADESDQESKAVYSPQMSVSQVGHSVERKRKSLFGNFGPTAASDASIEACAKTSLNTIKDREPCFKPSLLGSPFYPGRTMYGGASTSFYLNQPNVKQRKTAVVQETSEAHTYISSATRKVMDLLEHYSSPLIEAKRIPQYTRKPMDRINRSRSIAPYKTQELHTASPGVASLLRLKQRHKLQDSMSDVRQIVASQSSTCPHPASTTSTTEKDKFTAKIKSRVSATRPKRGDINDEMPTPLDLPTGGLVIETANLPKFSFTSATETQTTGTFETSKPQTITSKITETCKQTVQTSDAFKFATPIILSGTQPNEEDKSRKFTFGSPDREVDKNIDKVSSVVGSSEDSKSVDWKCNDCWINNKAQSDKCVCCGGAKTSSAPSPAPSRCTICKLAESQKLKDKCINCEKTALKNVGGQSKTDSKWKCDSCWVNNEENAEKCVCCENINPKKASATPSLTTVPGETADWRCQDCWITNKSDADKCAACGGLKPGAKKETSNSAFTMPVTNITSSSATKTTVTSEWRCEDCWVNNKNTIDKCIACGGGRPGSAAAATTVITINPLKDIAKSQAAKWECQSCLVRNESDALKCVCCDGAKPGSVKETDKKMFNFGVTPNTSFKFGIEPTKQPEPAKPAETKPLEVCKKIESETNNNSLENTPTFTFRAPKKSQSENTVSADKPKVQFTFGIPKQQADTVDAASMAKSLDTPKTTSEKSSTEEVAPKLSNFSDTKSTPATFTTLALATTSFTMLPSTPLLVTSASASEKKDTPSNLLIAPATKAESQPSFNFSSSTGIKLATNLFAAVTSTTVTTPSLSSPIMTSSLFTKPEAPATATTSIFKLGNSTTTGSIASAAAPIFSFGSGTAAPSSSEAKPAFTFTFGSNKNSETTMFKPPPAFGATDSATTKFSLPVTTSAVPSVTPAPTIATNNTPSTTNIFGASLPKENNMFMASTNAQPTANMFDAPSTTTNVLTKSATFSFGSTPFNASTTPAPAFGSNVSTNATPTFGVSATTIATPSFGASAIGNATPAFGSNASATTFGAPAQNNPPAFGAIQTSSIFGGSQSATAPAPAFGTAAQSPFGLPNQNSNNQSSLFSNPASSQSIFGGSSTTNPSTNLFGSPAASATPAFGSATAAFGTPAAAPQAFGAPAAGATFGPSPVGASPGFGAPNAALPAFKTPLLSSATAPAFNFGSPQQSPVFGFGQQQQQAGIYSFGAAGGASPVQFSIGTGQTGGPAPNNAVRKIRKATRRSTTLR